MKCLKWAAHHRQVPEYANIIVQYGTEYLELLLPPYTASSIISASESLSRTVIVKFNKYAHASTTTVPGLE